MLKAPPSAPNKVKKVYRKPELKTLNPRDVIAKLRPLALAGDQSAQQFIDAVRQKHGLR